MVGMPAFGQVLQAIVEAWTERRDDVAKVGADVTEHLQQVNELPGTSAGDVATHAVLELARTFDERHAGFGGAPKFPPSMVLEFLLRHAARTEDGEALRMATRTLEAMARGGIYDQLGGGFARYSVDASWDVPHFEKMLYDNAQLLRVYTHAYRQTRSGLAARVAAETARFMINELGTSEGGFASALDADSDGEEGVFYVWTPEQLDGVLGSDDAAYARAVFEVREGGNFEAGASTLRLAPDAVVTDDRFADVRERLLAARSDRTRPARDDKVVTAWNGLAIGALAEAGVILDAPDLLEAARRAARQLVDVHLVDGRLRRVSRDGMVGGPNGVLEDHACVADGLLALFAATGEREWFDMAAGLVRLVEEYFADEDGGFYDTAADAERLLKRPQDPMDNASPSGQAMTLTALVTMHGLTGDLRYAESGQRLAGRLSGLAERAPRFAGQTLTALEAMADGPRQVAVVGDLATREMRELVRCAHGLSHPGQVIAIGDGSVATVPLLESRTLVEGRPTAYACHDFVCDLPVTDPALLR